MAGFSNLRRLAADHAMLHSNELPPCYIFPFSNADSSVDDLTKLTVFLAGPDGTPYSQGLWRLSLKIPETYPKDPPKATFRTRIWHPNVEENTGSVCVDTLKRDWQPVLNLRDVLIVRAESLYFNDFSANSYRPDNILPSHPAQSRLSPKRHRRTSFTGRLQLICSSSETYDFNTCENTPRHVRCSRSGKAARTDSAHSPWGKCRAEPINKRQL